MRGRYRARLAGAWEVSALMLCVLCLMAGAAKARDRVDFDVTTGPSGQALGTYLGVLEDGSGALTIDDVIGPDHTTRFRRSTSQAPGFGFSMAAYWVRLDVRNRASAPRPWLLELAYPAIDMVDLYVPTADGTFEVRRTGDQRPFASRDLAHRTFVFKLSEPAGAARTYYLRLRTAGTLNVPLNAWSEDSLRARLNVELPLIWMFYGLTSVMALYNLFVFFSVRKRDYLYYCLYVLSFTALQATLNGHLFQYLFPESPWFASRALPLSLGLTLCFALHFVIHFLSLKDVLPWAYRWVFWGAQLSALLAVFGVVGSYSLSVRAQVLLGVLLSSLMLVVTVILVRRGVRQAKFYALAWSAFMIGVLLYYLRSAGVLPTNVVTEWSAQLGGAIEVVLLSLALADRINVMRRELSGLNAQLSQSVHELRDALRHAEEATRAKGEFLATVSHELRTPLNTIINLPGGLLREVPALPVCTCGYCQTRFALEPSEQVEATAACPECGRVGGLAVTAQREFTGDPERLAEYLGHIERSGKHLLEMVDGILDFSKLGAGRIELKLRDVELVPLLSEVVEPLRPLARSAGVALELVACPSNARLRADPLRLRQVLINLLGNAIKFSDGRGTVRLAVAQEPEGYVFRVSDEGIGIAPENLDKIFRSFEQVDQGDTRRFGGTGLGLAITKSLVEMHGGQIWVESALHHGASFFVRLPTTGPEGAVRSPAPPSRASQAPPSAADALAS